LSWSGRLQRMRESVFGYAAKSGSGLGPAVTNLLGGLPVWVAGLRIEIYGAGDATRVGCRSAQILADKILYRTTRIFGAPILTESSSSIALACEFRKFQFTAFGAQRDNNSRISSKLRCVLINLARSASYD
jgi:hypothetical protein